ncbi:LOW QUALITY PROTEIN: kelch repeat and BTB domain-containing protein 12 [Microcebus murinus]|uniref:LOW QUALITY PROTEIN: kelch repeat and BTB domain-containing protein 12 n=1 Tax=Microcebus murinus TaxID=30608 RepID=UPI003F6BF490
MPSAPHASARARVESATPRERARVQSAQRHPPARSRAKCNPTGALTCTVQRARARAKRARARCNAGARARGRPGPQPWRLPGSEEARVGGRQERAPPSPSPGLRGAGAAATLSRAARVGASLRSLCCPRSRESPSPPLPLEGGVSCRAHRGRGGGGGGLPSPDTPLNPEIPEGSAMALEPDREEKSRHGLQLLDAAQAMKELGQVTDVVPVAGERSSACHRLALAALSPYYFRAMFTCGFVECSRTEVALHGGVTAEGLSALLGFMSTGSLAVGASDVQEVAWASSLAQVAWASSLAQVAWASSLAQVAWASGLAQVAWASSLAQVAWASSLAQVAWASSLAQVAWASSLAQVAWASSLAQVAWASSLAQVAWASSLAQVAWASSLMQVAWASSLAQVAWASSLAQVAWASSLAQVAWASSLAQVAWASSLAQVAWASSLAQVAWASSLAQVAWASRLAQVAWASSLAQVAWASSLAQLAWASSLAQVDGALAACDRYTRGHLEPRQLRLGIHLSAAQIGARGLRGCAGRYLHRHFVEASLQEEMLQVGAHQLLGLVRSDGLHVAREEKVLDLVLRWAGHDRGPGAPHLAELLGQVTVRGGVVTEDNTVVVAGEASASGLSGQQSGDVEIYRTKTTNPEFLSVCLFICRLQKGLYVVGGHMRGKSQRLATSRVDRYSVGRDTWARASPLPIRLACHAAVAVDDRLCVTGGWTPQVDFPDEEPERLSNKLFRYDPGGDRWQELAPTRFSKYRFGSAVANGDIYVLGGIGCVGRDQGQVRQCLDAVEIYNPDGDLWREGPPMPRPLLSLRTNASNAGALGGRIHVCGGFRGAEDFCMVARMNPRDLIPPPPDLEEDGGGR